MGIRSVVYFAYLGDEGTDDDTVRQRVFFMDDQLRWLSRLIEVSLNGTGVLVPYIAPSCIARLRSTAFMSISPPFAPTAAIPLNFPDFAR